MPTTTVERGVVLDDYARDGYVIFRNVLDADLMGEVADHITWLEGKFPGRSLTELGATQLIRDAFWVRVISDDDLVDIASAFIGPDLAIFAANYLVKEPITGKRVEWHQDGPLWPLDRPEVVTLWLAIDHSTPENGCIRVVPGSHRSGALTYSATEPGRDLFGLRVDVEVDEADAVDIVLAPGDVEVRHPLIVHSSGANRSPWRRAGMNIHYIPTSTRITTEQQPYPGGALWLRGARGDIHYNPVPLHVEGEDFPFRDWKAWA